MAFKAVGAGEQGEDAGAQAEAEEALEGEDGEEVGEDSGPGEQVGEAGEEKGEGGGGGEGEEDAKGGGEDGRGVVDPVIKEAGGDLVEGGVAEQADLFAEVGLGEELLNGLLAEEGFGVRCGVEEVAGEAALAGAGADGREGGEEGVGAEEVEVAAEDVAGWVEVGVGAVGAGLGGGLGVGLGGLDPAEVSVVEEEESGLPSDAGAEFEGKPDEAGDREQECGEDGGLERWRDEDGEGGQGGEGEGGREEAAALGPGCLHAGLVEGSAIAVKGEHAVVGAGRSDGFGGHGAGVDGCAVPMVD